MKTVVQQDTTGCGLACVAMLAEEGYETVKKKACELGINTDDEKLWSDTNYVRTLLHEYSIRVSEDEKEFLGWSALPDLALLSIKYRVENGKPLWHWTVFKRQDGKGVVYDPAAYLEINEREDFADIQPKWFIEIL